MKNLKIYLTIVLSFFLIHLSAQKLTLDLGIVRTISVDLRNNFKDMGSDINQVVKMTMKKNEDQNNIVYAYQTFLRNYASNVKKINEANARLANTAGYYSVFINGFIKNNALLDKEIYKLDQVIKDPKQLTAIQEGALQIKEILNSSEDIAKEWDKKFDKDLKAEDQVIKDFVKEFDDISDILNKALADMDEKDKITIDSKIIARIRKRPDLLMQEWDSLLEEQIEMLHENPIFIENSSASTNVLGTSSKYFEANFRYFESLKSLEELVSANNPDIKQIRASTVKLIYKVNTIKTTAQDVREVILNAISIGK